MSIPEAIKGAQAELARVHSPLQRAQRLAVYARIFAAELFGTVLAVPFGLRAFSLHRSLPDARSAAGRAGTVSILRDVRYGGRERNVMDIYLPPSIELKAGSSLLLAGGSGDSGDEQAAPDAALEQEQAGQAGEASSAAAAASSPAGSAASEASPFGDLPARRGQQQPTGGDSSAGGDAGAAQGAPVCLFVHGGVWASGSKWHYAPLATRLAQAGVVTAVMHYTLYPQALVPQMVAEVSRALSWTVDNAEQLGGSPQQVSLVGHSAGAHMCVMALLHRALAAGKAAASKAAAGTAGGPAAGPPAAGAAAAAPPAVASAAAAAGGDSVPWSDAGEAAAFVDARMPARLVAMAGVYDIGKHYEYEEARHVHKLSTMERAIGGDQLFPAFSPAIILADALRRQGQGTSQGQATHKESWQQLAADPQELLKEAGVSECGAHGGRGWSGADSSRGGGSNGGGSGAAPAAPQAGQVPASGPACALVEEQQGQGQGQAAQAEEAAAELPAVAAARYYQSFELAGEAIARRIGFDRVAAAEAAAAEAAAEAALAGTLPELRAARAAAAARAVPAAAPAASAAAVAADSPAAGGEGTASSGLPHGGVGPWRIFGLSVEDARRLPPTVLTSSCTDVTVPWYESAEMFWRLHDCGVPAKHLVYNKVSHGDFVTGWAALPRISGRRAEEESDLPAHAADLVKVLSGRAAVRYGCWQ